MTDERYTDEKIIKALKHCADKDNLCGECPLFKGIDIGCSVSKLALDLINRQKVEIERLQKEVNLVSIQFQDLQEGTDEIKAKAYKKFADKLQEENTPIEREESI